MTETRTQRRLAAILAADVVGFSRLMEQDETGTLDALWQSREIGPSMRIDHLAQGIRCQNLNGIAPLIEVPGRRNEALETLTYAYAARGPCRPST